MGTRLHHSLRYVSWPWRNSLWFHCFRFISIGCINKLGTRIIFAKHFCLDVKNIFLQFDYTFLFCIPSNATNWVFLSASKHLQYTSYLLVTCNLFLINTLTAIAYAVAIQLGAFIPGIQVVHTAMKV